MIESYVDLTYRGLALGRRVKLAQVRPTSGYLEVPAPMPVGTVIAIATDEGVTLVARVLSIQEQVGSAAGVTGPIPVGGPAATTAEPANRGGTAGAAGTSGTTGAIGIGGLLRTPGMLVAPVLTDAAAVAWWEARVALPELDPAAITAAGVRMKPTTVRPRSRTVSEAGRSDDAASAAVVAAPAAVPVAAASTDRAGLEADLAAAAAVVNAPLIIDSAEHSIPELVDDGKRTTVMDAIDPETLSALLDDGRRTQAMASVDLAALGLESSGSVRASSESDDSEADADASGELSADVTGAHDASDAGAEARLKTAGGSVKRRRKKR